MSGSRVPGPQRSSGQGPDADPPGADPSGPLRSQVRGGGTPPGPIGSGSTWHAQDPRPASNSPTSNFRRRPRAAIRTARAGSPKRLESPPVLRIGSRGPWVKTLQGLLNQHLTPSPQLALDGVFGQATQAAVFRFQKFHRIGADGIVGPLTWAYLPRIKTTGPARDPVEVSNGLVLKATITQTVITNLPAAPSTPTPTAKSSPPLDIEQWSIKDKLIEAMRRAVPKMPAGMRDQFAALLSPLNIGITAATITVWALGHFFGVSEVADAVLVAAAWYFVGRAALDFGWELGRFADIAVHAKTEQDLEDAAQHLANAVSIVGVTVFMILLAKAAKPAADSAGQAIKQAGEKARSKPAGGEAPTRASTRPVAEETKTAPGQPSEQKPAPPKKQSGKEAGEAGKPYEKDVQEASGGKSEVIEGREIDSVTDEALIQAKDSRSATESPHNFLNKKTRAQIKETIRLAQERGKRAEFWFKQGPHPEVREYIESKGGIVKTKLGE